MNYMIKAFVSSSIVAMLISFVGAAQTGRTSDPVTLFDADWDGIRQTDARVNSNLGKLLANNHRYENSSTLSGRIYDGFGAHVPGAKISLRNQDSGNTFETVSDAEGKYRLVVGSKNESNGGIFRIEVVRDPYEVFRIEKYQLIFKGSMSLDVCLICVDCEIVNTPSGGIDARGGNDVR